MQISELAALIIETEGVKDFLLAKKKAANRLGINNSSHLPTNNEVQQALIDYQNLFYGSEEKQIIQHNAKKCLHALNLLKKFEPYLTGAYAGTHPSTESDIEIILYLDQQEQLVSCLSNQKIPWQLKSVKMKLPQRQIQEYPCYQFYADDTLIKIICLPEHEIHTRYIDLRTNEKISKLDIEKSRYHLNTTFNIQSH